MTPTGSDMTLKKKTAGMILKAEFAILQSSFKKKYQ